jgi:hypothetical protein
MQLKVTDVNGKIVYSKKVSSIGTILEESINMQNLPKGIYILSVIYNSRDIQTVKIVKL